MFTLRRSWVLTLWLGLACQPTSSDIAQWKGTERGPAKIRDALRSHSAPLEVRGQALAALAELGMLEELDADCKALSPVDQGTVVHDAAPRLIALAQGADPAAPPTRVMKSAKDALFYVRGYATPADRDTIDEALMRWVTVDLGTRGSAGGVGAEKVLAAVGPERAGPALARAAIQAGQNRAVACELLGRAGDKASRQKAALELVPIAARERPLRDETLRCLGQIGGPGATAFLLETAEKGSEEARVQAMRAMELRPEPYMLGFALRMAKDRGQPGAVREEAFGLIETVGGDAAVQGLLPLLSDTNKDVGRRAIEAALAAGKAAAIRPVLERLPVSLVPEREDLRDFVVRDLVKLGPPALGALKIMLSSPSALARLAALLAIGELGGAKDASAVQKLAGDGARVGIKGLAGGGTVGAEARQIVEKLRRKG